MSGAVSEPDRAPPFGLAEWARLARSTLAGRQSARVSAGIDGAVGDALFACALARIDESVDVNAWLARAISTANSRRPGPSLHNGVAGLGFLLACYADGVEDRLMRIDGLLTATLSSLPPASMQSGVAGIALYAALRSHAATGRALQRAIVSTLADAATPSDGGLLWHTPLDYALARGVPASGAPVIELGMVHGLAGTLVALATLAAAGHERAADLARAGLVALFAREQRGDNRFGRIDFGPPDARGVHEFTDSRWCIGDVGVFHAAHRAARIVHDDATAERALAWLRESAAAHAAGAAAGASGRYDLCCGAAVIAQIYWRLHRDTGEPLFSAANRRLLDACATEVAAMTQTSFAYGRAGTLLALLSPLVDEAPSWDGVLGLASPTTPEMRRERSTMPLLQALGVERFLAEHWEQRALFVAGASATPWASAFGRETFFQLAETSPRGLKAQTFTADGMHTERALLDGADARRLFDSGHTLCLAGVERLHAPIGELAVAVQSALRLSASVQINAYLSPAGGGFGLHFDDHGVIILQLEGEKRWFHGEEPLLPGAPCNLVAGSTGEARFRALHPWFTAPFPDDAALLQTRLRPGDLLYLPTGTPHRTEAGAHSLAITIAFESMKGSSRPARQSIRKHDAAAPLRTMRSNATNDDKTGENT
jgi:hypothetical protein